MNFLKNLPHEIEQLIYSYDDTYKPKRNSLWNPIFMDIVKQEQFKQFEPINFTTYEYHEWLSFNKRVYNKINYSTMKEQSEENLKVGDIFKIHFNYKYSAFAIITRMTKKTIFYKFLKEKKYSEWFNNNDWGSSETLYKFNINNLNEMKEKRMKKKPLDIIDTDKINLNKNFYYKGHISDNLK